ncbi:hypothetical protein [Paeniglutamicibacter sp. Y32M11]|uniref:hypothetical protein n=1 Tax=Paeniglutamicibacter sp. Y32M11 TaxID=2853258 RepID=UPI001C52AF19|nr:hypothetical protein [Paeniglutamicibacter sp. Y32M11]QXQ11346.1 hypothetical protein KUF55_05470 [Paeniglutamicibacter sp. Y32M11]
MRNNPTDTTHQLQQVVRRIKGSWVLSKLRRKPMIVPVALEAKDLLDRFKTPEPFRIEVIGGSQTLSNSYGGGIRECPRGK